MIYRIRNKTGFRMQMKFGEGRLFVENGQQFKVDFMPPLSTIILNSRKPYSIYIQNTTELLDGQTRVIDIGLVEPVF